MGIHASRAREPVTGVVLHLRATNHSAEMCKKKSGDFRVHKKKKHEPGILKVKQRKPPDFEKKEREKKSAPDFPHFFFLFVYSPNNNTPITKKDHVFHHSCWSLTEIACLLPFP